MAAELVAQFETAYGKHPAFRDTNHRLHKVKSKMCESAEWTDDLTVKFINAYEKHPVLWDTDHCFYKVKCKKSEAWSAIAGDLGIGEAQLKKKMNSLLATYRKVRRKNSSRGLTSGDDLEQRTWFAFRAFAFLHDRYQPRWTIKRERDDDCDSQQEDGDETEDNSGQTEIIVKGEWNEPPPPAKQKKVFVSPKRIAWRNASEDPRMVEPYDALRSPLNKRDELDAYGEYIANTLRSMDRISRAFVKKEFAEAIFRAESGAYQFPYPPDFLRPGSSSSYTDTSASNIPSPQPKADPLPPTNEATEPASPGAA